MKTGGVMNAIKRGARMNPGWLALGALLTAASCGGEGEKSAAGDLHDTGSEILGDPQAVVAIVEDHSITLAEVDLVTRFWVESRALQAQQTGSRKELQQKALDHMIDQILLSNEALRHQVSVSDSVVDQMMVAWETGFGNPEELQAKLAAGHVSKEKVRESFLRDRLVQGLVAEVIQDTVAVTDAQVRAYYDAHPELFDTSEMRVSHILLMVSQGDPPESLEVKRARAEGILDQVKAGAPFAELAVKYSDCPSSEKGGDLGFGRKGQWVKPFADAAFALQPGEVSGVVETRFGFHIIKGAERRGGGLTAYEEVADRIRQYLIHTRVQSAMQAMAAQLRAGSRVEVRI